MCHGVCIEGGREHWEEEQTEKQADVFADIDIF